MKRHIQKETDTFMDDITRNAVSPATQLFQNTQGCKKERGKVREFVQRSGITFVYFEEMQVIHANGSGFSIRESCGTRQR